MSSDLYEFEECFFTDPFSPLSDSSSIDILKVFQETNYNLTPLTHEHFDHPFDEIDQIAPTNTTTTPLLSSSPPSHQLESLSLNQMGNSVNSLDLCPIEVKTEESQLPFYDYYQVNTNSFLPHSYGGCENAVKMMQRSYSSKSFDGRPNGFLFQPKFDSLIESSNLQSQFLTSPDHGSSSSSSHMRRVCSTGDLQSLKVGQQSQRLSSSPLGTEGSFMEEANFKVGRYSPEERKERILRYKAKRTQRNFNKTIKYACRKTLADNRPRIRGRFARTDEPDETSKTLNFQRYEDEDELWLDGLQEEYYEGIPRQHFFNTYMPTTQFHQFSYIPK
ncbi:hypothetical protein L1987_56234 [Smallanthus sonchifolius]|uniref:Uncharacterized protein n=1 Tax=Smallanthus sonchifolius TaxID=185202 RepID=A0ACB9EBS4_9ASTR|nr:hypothetical protein L1987_56234 [Smallanthus sonchifolius]